MLSYTEVLKTLDEESNHIKEYGVSRIGLFGSFARNQQTEKSDVDILVEFEEGKESFDNYMSLLFFLEKIFSKRVDLVISGNVRDELKNDILGSVKYASSYRLYLSDINKCIEKIEKYTQGVTFEVFASNGMLQDAIIRNLEIIGEAIKNLPEDIKRNDEYLWNKYARVRDLISHFYFGVNYNIIWGLVKSVSSELKTEVNKLIQ